MKDILELYHTSFSVISEPDVKIGRANADFGQGFYLSDDMEFSRRWAKERVNCVTYLNRYELATDGLLIKCLERNDEWFNYTYRNRAGYADDFKEYDLIIGPIANDTIYDTFGILTSGLIGKEDALKLLMNGPAYRQIVVKSENAAKALHFVDATAITKAELAAYGKMIKIEEEAFQEKLALFLEESE